MDLSGTRERVTEALEPARERASEFGHQVADRAGSSFQHAREASRPHLEQAAERVAPAAERASAAASTAASAASEKASDLAAEIPGGVAGVLSSLAGVLTSAASRIDGGSSKGSSKGSTGRPWVRNLAIFGGGVGVGALGGYALASRRGQVHEDLWVAGEIDGENYGQEAAQLDAKRRAANMS